MASRIFYDDFESGNLNLWTDDGAKPHPTIVTTAADGGLGPYAGTRMLRCNNSAVDLNYESVKVPVPTIGNEMLVRYQVRIDANHTDGNGSTHKLTRIFDYDGVNLSTYTDIFAMAPTTGPGSTSGLWNDMILHGDRHPPGGGESLYFGDAVGDHSCNTNAWHEIKYYVNKATGLAKTWHDNIVVQSGTWSLPLSSVTQIYVISNWDDPHSGNNYVYFDNFEVWTDLGSSSVTGTLANGDIQLSGGSDTMPPAAPTNLRFA